MISVRSRPMSDRPLLWLPSSAVQQLGHTREGENDGPSLIVYDTIGEITQSVPDLPGVLASKLLAFAPLTLLAIVSNVNARLLLDGMSNPSLHAQLEVDLVHPELLARLQPVRSQRTAQQSVIFTRRSLLLLAKISLGLQRGYTGGDANEREIGTCTLIVNELLQPTVEPSDDLLVVDIMANWDLFMPLDVPHVLARFRLLMRRLLTSTDPRGFVRVSPCRSTSSSSMGSRMTSFRASLSVCSAWSRRRLSGGRPRVSRSSRPCRGGSVMRPRCGRSSPVAAIRLRRSRIGGTGVAGRSISCGRCSWTRC